MQYDFDIVVIGGGHAGVEAARASAVLGAKTALVTLSADTIAQMSCNPAIGGVGKGQIVREIDALGGLMGLAADATGMQFRMLNRSKGPAVWGPRCQSDRHAYAAWVQRELSRTENLSIVQGEAMEILVANGRVAGVGVDGGDISCRAVIVTAGTFLNALMHLGEEIFPGGRYDEPASVALGDSLRKCGLRIERLKTGTPPRLAAGSINYDRCRRQDGDEVPTPFSFLNDSLDVEQVPCWLTETTPQVHEAIRANFHRAPLYTGQISASGPRYCPSIETKLEKFPDKTSHQVFLEPEGRDTDWVYCNGISTSLPPDVQEFMVRHIPGLEDAKIIRFGYAIEYDYAPPTQLDATLETKCLAGLYLAGQVNGTTGYEEAAGQGLLAGANAALSLAGREPLVLRRDQAYIGVMIDDLVTRGVTEPYRMFTSRAEYRLSLRADNADRRLTQIGRATGLAGEGRWKRFRGNVEAIERARKIFMETRLDGKTLWEYLRRPGARPGKLIRQMPTEVGGELAELLREHPSAVNGLAIDARYAGYIAKEQSALRQMQELDDKPIPPEIDYASLRYLRHEAREKLQAIRPRCLGQALRVSGITPADITVLQIHLATLGSGKKT